MKGTWVPSQKGTNLLKDSDGFRYRKFREIKAGITYRCTKKDALGCPAVAMIDKNTITDCEPDILEINHLHNHGSDVIGPEVRWIENESIHAAALVGKIIINCRASLFHFKSVQCACNTKLIPQYDIVFVV